jgi:uncharacterized protein YerC
MSRRNELREDVAAMLRDGATYDAIRQQLGVSTHQISATRKAYRITYTTGPGRRITPDERPLLEQQVCELARAGATYAQIEAAAGISAPTILAIRSKHGLPKPARGRRNTGRPLAEALALYTHTDSHGHLHWTGPYAGRAPALSAQGRRYNARHVTFRAHHGRDPVGYVLNTCLVTDCIAGAHLNDKTIRDQLDQTYTAIFGRTAAQPRGSHS